jgi:hypothetical protein
MEGGESRKVAEKVTHEALTATGIEKVEKPFFIEHGIFYHKLAF